MAVNGAIRSEHFLSKFMNRRAETSALIEPLLTLPEVAALLKIEGDVERTIKRLLKKHCVPTQKLQAIWRLRQYSIPS